MIIETAIPEIEEEANRILSRMTDGRMHVKFETQRDVRSGIGTIETLDINIADELGTRSYEMFSGGEGFRVNFAIRIALSRLLAHRAGTRLQTLVIDEGFGSQDQEGRDRIVEAIQAIEPEFEKILVITHLEDLRERFPVRIEVTKTSRGSTYALR
jgi:exonuclease SbcC